MQNFQQNYLIPTRFKFQFTKLPTVAFNCQNVPIPGISVPSTTQPTPFRTIEVPGDHLEYEPLQLEFLVDDLLTNYFAISGWLHGYAFPQDFQQYVNILDAGLYSDGSLLIYDGANNYKYAVKFSKLFPISLSKCTFKSDVENISIITASAQFRFLKMDIIDSNSQIVGSI